MEEDFALNADLNAIAFANTASMAWEASPSPTVWRKRLHLSGSAEAGVVTSIVRYDAGASFRAHGHPGGEEIFVLDGTFSDEHGDWPVGTYLLNPEGFSHAPFSTGGCVLFVKLRQYAGARSQLALDTASGDWEATGEPGVSVKVLYRVSDFPDYTSLERWDGSNQPRALTNTQGLELLVLVGECEWMSQPGVGEALVGGPGTWLRFPPGVTARCRSLGGCELFVKRNHLA